MQRATTKWMSGLKNRKDVEKQKQKQKQRNRKQNTENRKQKVENKYINRKDVQPSN